MVAGQVNESYNHSIPGTNTMQSTFIYLLLCQVRSQTLSLSPITGKDTNANLPNG